MHTYEGWEKGTDEPICRAGTETQRADLWAQQRRASREWRRCVCTTICKWLARGGCCKHRALSSELCHGLEVGRDGRVEGAQEGGDMCVLTADLRCMAETHPAL